MNTEETEMLDKQQCDREDAALRENLGQMVRDVWTEWAKEQPSPKPSWLVPWAELSEADKDVDRRIGERLFREGARAAIADIRSQGRMRDKHTISDTSNAALSNSLRSLIATLETVDADERERAREEGRSAHVHTSTIREANAALLDHGR